MSLVQSNVEILEMFEVELPECSVFAFLNRASQMVFISMPNLLRRMSVHNMYTDSFSCFISQCFKFQKGYRIKRETPEEGWRIQLQKHCEYKNQPAGPNSKVYNNSSLKKF